MPLHTILTIVFFIIATIIFISEIKKGKIN